MKAEDREPLAQALFDAGYGVGEQVDIDRLKAKLAALGYEVRPIDDERQPIYMACGCLMSEGSHANNLEGMRSAHPDLAIPDEVAFVRGYYPIEQAAEAADAAAEAAYQDSQNTDPQYRPSAAVAPLVAKVLAAGDELTAEHGESCDCEICLAVQPLVDAAVDLAAADAIRKRGGA